MAIPALVLGAVKAYSTYKTLKNGIEVADSASKLASASMASSKVLDQVKTAVNTFDGGVTGRKGDGEKGLEIDMPKLAGLFPQNAGGAAPGMQPQETSFLHGFLANMIDANEGAQGGNAPQGPDKNGPSNPGM